MKLGDVLWISILFSAVTALLFRFLPFFMKDSTVLNNQNGILYRFLSYSTQAMLGVIVYDSTFKGRKLLEVIHAFDWLSLFSLLLLVGLFIWVVYSKRILSSFFVSLGVYFLFLYLFL